LNHQHPSDIPKNRLNQKRRIGATLFIFLDTETTGTEKDDRLCQLAYKLETGEIVNKLFKPPLPIAIEPMCVHHITNEMVENKPAFKGRQDHQKLAGLLLSII